MATKRITLTGTAEWCKPYPHQIDRAFEDNTEGPDPKGGNSSMVLILDEASTRLYNALGARAKIRDGKLTLRRYERHPRLGELGPVVVSGVEDGTLIGNGSRVSVDVDVYDYEYNGRSSKGVRWVSVTVDELVEFTRETSKPAPAISVPAA